MKLCPISLLFVQSDVAASAQERNNWHKPEDYGCEIPDLCCPLSLGAISTACQSTKGMWWLITEEWQKPGDCTELILSPASDHPLEQIDAVIYQPRFRYQKSLWTINYWGPSSLTSIPHCLNHLDPPPKLCWEVSWSMANCSSRQWLKGTECPGLGISPLRQCCLPWASHRAHNHRALTR